MRAARRMVARRKIFRSVFFSVSPFAVFPETEISYLNQASPVSRGKKDVQLCLNKLAWK
jgi:hypothetical protein